MKMDNVEISEIKNLTKLESAIKTKKKFIVIDGDIKLTKTQKNYTQALLYRDTKLEQKVFSYLEKRIGQESLFHEYTQYEQNFLNKKINSSKAIAISEQQPKLKEITLPNHCAMNVLCGTGALASGANIFMFHHGVSSACTLHNKSFGFEFIDVWDNIFTQSILPCTKKVFDISSQLKFKMNLFADLDRTIYLASIFHEIGHQVGPWKVSPIKDKHNSLNSFAMDVLGELSTDSLLITKLKEFPELAEFIILQRLFWFGRRGFKENPIAGKINQDNDAWIGAYLWLQLKKYKVITVFNGILNFNHQNVQTCFDAILAEIDDLYFKSRKSKKTQQQLVQDWMKKSVPSTNGKFFYPKDYQQILTSCQEIIEEPLFLPTFAFSNIEELKKAAVRGNL
jgi:hypothetical protein